MCVFGEPWKLTGFTYFAREGKNPGVYTLKKKKTLGNCTPKYTLNKNTYAFQKGKNGGEIILLILVCNGCMDSNRDILGRSGHNPPT